MSNPNINPYKKQYTASGTQVDFVYDFELVKGRDLFVYATLAGATPNDLTDLQNSNNYTIIPDNPAEQSSKGKVRFNSAPANGTIITITPSQQTDVSYTFTNTEEFNRTSLDGAFKEVALTLAYDLYNFKSSCLRYDYNAINNNVDYDNRLPFLPDLSFWRRKENKVIAQDYAEFIQEVEGDIAIDIKNKVDAGADNTNFAADIATKAFPTQFSGSVKTVDENGNIVVGPVITGLSALGGAHSAKLWAQDDVEITNDGYGNSGYSAKFGAGVAKDWAMQEAKINDVYGNTGYSSKKGAETARDWAQDPSAISDVYGNTGYSAKVAAEQSKNWAESQDPVSDVWGNTGFSAKHYAEQAQTAASAAGGLVTDLVHYDETNPTTRVDLIDYSITPNEPWIRVYSNSMTVYIDGLMLPNPESYDSNGVIVDPPYTLVINSNPTLGNPSYIHFNPAIPAGSKIQVCRSVAQGNSVNMFVDGSNAEISSSNNTLALQIAKELFPVGAHSFTPFYNGIGMTWTKLPSGRMLVTSDGTNAGDHAGTAIEATIPAVDGHALTLDEIPTHAHQLSNIATGTGSGEFHDNLSYTSVPYSSFTPTPLENSTAYSGGGAVHTHTVSWAHYNLEVWVRTA